MREGTRTRMHLSREMLDVFATLVRAEREGRGWRPAVGVETRAIHQLEQYGLVTRRIAHESCLDFLTTETGKKLWREASAVEFDNAVVCRRVYAWVKGDGPEPYSPAVASLVGAVLDLLKKDRGARGWAAERAIREIAEEWLKPDAEKDKFRALEELIATLLAEDRRREE